MNNFMLAVGCLLVLSCSSSGPEALHERYCGSCHLAPDPADLPKQIWEKSVLPEMGARLGMKTPDFDRTDAKGNPGNLAKQQPGPDDFEKQFEKREVKFGKYILT